MKSKIKKSAIGQPRQKTITARKVTITEAISDTEDEIIMSTPTPKKSSNRQKSTQQRIAAAPTHQPTKEELNTFLEAMTAFKGWKGITLLKDDEMTQVQESLKDLSSLLRSKASSEKSRSQKNNPKSPTQLDQLYVFRKSSREVIILRPVDIISCNAMYTMEKNVAYFRIKGAPIPQEYALSGEKPCTDNQIIVIDPAWSLYQIRKLGDFHEHRFRSNGWDSTQKAKERGSNKGDGFACHAEKQAMLAAAFFLLEKLTGLPRFETSVGKLYLLQRFKTGKEVEIGISEGPCYGCKDFRSMLQDITGIHFDLIVLTNLAAVKKQSPLGEKKKLYPEIDSEGFVVDKSKLVQDPRAKVTQILMERLEKNNEYLTEKLRLATRTIGRIDQEGLVDLAISEKCQLQVVIQTEPKLRKKAAVANDFDVPRCKPAIENTSSSTTIITRKRTFRSDDDWGEFNPSGKQKAAYTDHTPKTPKRRRATNTGTLMTPSRAEDLADLEMYEQHFQRSTSITERFKYRN